MYTLIVGRAGNNHHKWMLFSPGAQYYALAPQFCKSENIPHANLIGALRSYELERDIEYDITQIIEDLKCPPQAS